MDSPPLDNQTEFEVHPQLLLTREGERLLVVVKATFELALGSSVLALAPADRARPIRFADEPWEAPEVDSIRYPSDVTAEKAGTDVVFVGAAHAPHAAPVPYFDAYLRVGPVAKAVRVFGLRVWEARGAALSAPRPTLGQVLRYDYAFGGRDLSDPEHVTEEARNPVGLGVATNLSALTHQVGPSIEDPNEPIGSARSRPAPIGLGVVGRSFAPRRELAGTFDEAWLEMRAPLPPVDEDPAFHQVASPGLVARPHLSGGEECALLNLGKAGSITFALPAIRLTIEGSYTRREPVIVRPPLDTVLIDTLGMSAEEPAVVELVYRALLPYPRKLADCLITVREGA